MYEFLNRFKYIYCKILCYVLCKSIFVFITCAICWFQKDLVGQRGLLPNTEQQTFVMTLPRKLRLKYEEVLLAVALEVHTKILSVLCPTYNMNLRPFSGLIILMWFFQSAAGPQAGKEKGGLTEKQVEAYNIINKFLSTFIDHVSEEIGISIMKM